jgi:hypothetical protein
LQDRGMQIQTFTTTRIQHFLRLSAMLLPCYGRARAMLLPCSCNGIALSLFLLLLCSHPCSCQAGQEHGKSMTKT